MSDTVDMYRDLKDLRKEKRRVFGVPCPMCREKQPNRNPTILLPQQRCRVDGYRDPRPELTQADYDKLFQDTPHAD
ncbi:MAG: hypothetical protein AB7E24_25265 [Novosphingobium sp.]